MMFNPSPTSTPTSLLWIGRILSGLIVAFLLLDAAMKLVPIEAAIDTMRDLGFISTPDLARSLGGLLLVCTLLYAIPRTALLGAVLLTGYLGGAMAIQLRAGNPVFSHILFGGYIGVLLWTGLLLRNKNVCAMVLPQIHRIRKNNVVELNHGGSPHVVSSLSRQHQNKDWKKPR